jgi:VWFA-related protein
MASLSHRQGWSLAVLLTVFPCVFFASTKNEAPSVTFRASTSEVRVSFFATDEDNRLVENLTQNDFAIVDRDRVIRDFRSLTRSNETALDIVLLVDTSESVAPGFRRITEDALRIASQHSASQNADSLATSGDRVSVITFSGLKPAILCQENCSDPDSQLKLASLKPAGPTPLFDTLAFTARFITERQDPAVREVLILFSDGNDTISLHSAQDAVDSLAASGALVYSVDMAPDNRPSNGRAFLREMAENTGGRYFRMHDGAASVLQAVLDDLHASYVVSYQLPTRAAGFHSLRILPKHNLNLRFHCRRGYFYDEKKQ